MSIFTRLSLFFFLAFVVISGLPLLSEEIKAEQVHVLTQLAVSLCMGCYLLDLAFRGKSRTAQESDVLKNLEKAAVDVEQTALVKSKDARITELEAKLKSQQAQLAAGESKLKAQDAANPEQAVVQFLRSLQNKGRLIDFAMTDIHRIPDPQVGAVARVVHQGVRELLQDYFEIVPVAKEEEGSLVPVEADGLSPAYRVLQDGAPNASGRLIHRGWQTLSRRLPHSVQKESEENLRVLAPAEIDARTNA